MGGSTRGNAGDFPAEEQPWCKKPFSLLAPARLPLGPFSPCQEWQKPYCMSIIHGGAACSASSSGAMSYLQCSGASSYPNQTANQNGKRVENPTPENPALKYLVPTNGTGSAVSGAAVGGSTVKTDHQAQLAAKPVLGRKINPNMDPKTLKRMMANRLSAQKARMKKMQELTDLEERAKAFKDRVAVLHPLLASYKHQKLLLTSEQKILKQQLAVLEKQKLLQEAEMEKNRTEVNMLREVGMMQEQQFRALLMFNWDAGLQLMSNYPNSCPVAQNGRGASEMNINMPQNLGQIFTAGDMDEQTPNLSLPRYSGWTRF